MTFSKLAYAALAVSAVPFLMSAAAPSPADQVPTPATMQMSTPSFTDGGLAPDKHTCMVKEAVSPGFTWIDPPTKTVSYTLMFHVPDVHPNKGKDDSFHWAVWNIPGAARSIAEALPKKTPLPDGSQQTVHNGEIGYSPMCGRPGKKLHYMFELYALDVKLNVPATAGRDELLAAMDGHIIGKNVYIGRFSKPGPLAPVGESSF
jgi:Raf kinase inhibitor-like YbhB/YbcL family protein